MEKQLITFEYTCLYQDSKILDKAIDYLIKKGHYIEIEEAILNTQSKTIKQIFKSDNPKTFFALGFHYRDLLALQYAQKITRTP